MLNTFKEIREGNENIYIIGFSRFEKDLEELLEV